VQEPPLQRHARRDGGRTPPGEATNSPFYVEEYDIELNRAA
jgi:hypothetical protein